MEEAVDDAASDMPGDDGICIEFEEHVSPAGAAAPAAPAAAAVPPEAAAAAAPAVAAAAAAAAYHQQKNQQQQPLTQHQLNGHAVQAATAGHDYTTQVVAMSGCRKMPTAPRTCGRSVLPASRHAQAPASHTQERFGRIMRSRRKGDHSASAGHSSTMVLRSALSMMLRFMGTSSPLCNSGRMDAVMLKLRPDQMIGSGRSGMSTWWLILQRASLWFRLDARAACEPVGLLHVDRAASEGSVHSEMGETEEE